ncbi:hypothetical protein CEP52_014009 [Fusarium oligoseptatum]|uniref:Major facilitator superfamily (MFS) profile domain-containing protein n=1 Tax=Fusarium oligoseptatum TaxID=2604345 RepID=A0A428SQP7_9HYPO|nr:hypothetical protein CEP52_014009 [Fusarium oligoseptatum]
MPSRVSKLKLGNCYYTAAEKRLGAAFSRVDTLSIQCLCLAGIYHMYLIRPIHALRLFHAAGSSLQMLLSTNSDYSAGNQVAEVVNKYIDARIRHEQGPRVEDLVPIVAGFRNQVQSFRELLPEAIKFPDVPEPASTEWEHYSRGRYYRVLELMHRPFVFGAIHDPTCSPAIQALAKTGLENGLKYLQHSRTSHRHHGLWLQLRNQVRISSLLLAASTIPNFTMPEGWYDGILRTLATLDYWECEFPSCKSYKEVILTLSARNVDGGTPMSLVALPDTNEPWWKQAHLLRLNALLGICCLSAATVGYDGAMMNALQINPNWKSYYNYPEKAILGAINAMLPTGKIIGFLFVAPFSNRFGRKTALVLSFAITIIGAAIQAASNSLGVLIFSRFFLGFGCGVMSQPSPILLAEMAYPPHRGKLTALYHCFYFVGAIAAAWITFESPSSPPFRYLIAKGRDDEARAILTKHHAAGHENSALVDLEVTQIRDAVRTAANTEKRPSLGKMVTSPVNRRRLLISTLVAIAAQWSGNTVVSYYLVLVLNGIGVTNATHQSLINGGLQIFNLFATVGCGAMLVDILGRRRLFQWSAIGMTLSYIIWTILNARFAATGFSSYGFAVIPMLFVFYFHYDIALTPLLYSYPTELFTYEWRSWGVAYTLIVTNLSQIIGQFCNPIAMAKIGWKYYIVFCVLDALFIAQVWFLFPETKGKSLEELASLFEKLEDASARDPEKLKVENEYIEKSKALSE